MIWPWSVIEPQRKGIERLKEQRAHDDKWIQIYQKLYLERSRDLYAAHKGIRRFSGSCSSHEEGAAMTRKEELRNRAEELRFELFLDMHDRPGFDRGHLLHDVRKDWDVTWDEIILKVLQQVEQEVWEKVDRYYSNQIHYDMDDYPDKFIRWVREQKELAR